MTKITQKDLAAAYTNAVRHLIPFTKNARENKPVKLNEIQSLFRGSLWEKVKSSGSGHVKLRHKITSILVEYQGHYGSRRDTVIQHQIRGSILDQVQEHLNTLGNDIFGYTKNNWKTEPNYAKSLNRLEEMNKSSKTV